MTEVLPGCPSSGAGARAGDVAVHHRRCGPDALRML